MPLPTQLHERQRLAELDRYAILSTSAEAAFDQITALASHFFRCPVALLSFVDSDRQWFKSAIGTDLREFPRSQSLCAWAILGDGVMVVPDAAKDPRFADNPLVTGPVGIRFYAAAPLVTPSGYSLGTVCVIDTKPRDEGLSSADAQALAGLAKLVMHALETRLAAHEAQETRNLLQTTLSSIGDGVITVDSQLSVTFLNPVAEQLTGWTFHEARGQSVQAIFPIVNEITREPVVNPIKEALSQLRTGGLPQRTVLLSKDGREIAIDDTAAPIFRGSAVAGAVLIFRDVTKRREAERALERSESLFRTTFAKAPLGHVLTHLDGRFIEANEAYRAITGYTNEELKNVPFISLTHPDEIAHNRELFRRLVEREIDSYALEKRIFTKDHKMRWVRAHASLLGDEEGELTRVVGLIEDITERKEAELRFHFLAESVPQMVWTATPEDGLLDYVNRQGCEYFGTDEQSLLGTGWLAGVHPDDQPGAVETWMAALRSGENYATQFRLKRARDSTWRLHLARALPLRGEDGVISKWFGTCTDIEDQNQASQQVEQDRQRWRDLVLHAPAGIAVLRGPQHRFESVNADYARLVGRTRTELEGHLVRDVFPEVAAQTYSKLLDDVYRTGEPVSAREAALQLNRGGVLETFYINFVYLPTKNRSGEIDGIFVHVIDVTDMVNARRAIEASEVQFHTLAESIPHLAWMADPAGYIFWYNKRWFDFTGTAMEDMEGWGWQSVHDPQVLPEVVKNWSAAIAEGKDFEMIFPLRGADGNFRNFLTRVQPVKDDAGKVVRWFGTNTDITDQRRTEERLRRINRDLEEFSYIASHDLKEPLRMVNIYTQMILQGKDRSREELVRFSGYVSLGVQRMGTLIDELLNYSRNVHADDAAPGAAHLAVAFEDAIGILKAEIEGARAVITVADLPLARGDTARMAHVFQNVLSNALKYRKADVPPRIDVSCERQPDRWVISIKDNGIGFEPEHADRIFGMFKRLHREEYPGTGLGLALCRRIVERYGGEMWADSTPGQGSTFYFGLPFA